jgi:putative hydrolase of the HAD superfamily
MGTRAQLGEISDAELWRWVGRRLELSASQLEAFRRDFWSGDILDVEIVGAIRGLRPRYQTAIISNATDALRDNLASAYPIADAFDLIVVSAEEHTMKPDHEIYERTLRRLGRPPGETVFIDDNPGNIAAARELGMNAILFNPTLDLHLELAAMGVHFGTATDDHDPAVGPD